MTSYAVIGGGIAGLVAAYRLQKKGHEVILFEKGEIGGAVRSSSIEGFTLERGAGVLVEKEALSALIDELHLRESIRYPRYANFRQHLWCRGAPQRVPKDPLQFLITPLLPLKDKIALLRKLFTGGRDFVREEDESVAKVFGRLIGEEGLRTIIDPALQGIYGGNIATLSARSLFPQIIKAFSDNISVIDYMRSRGAKRKMFVLQGGNQMLCEALMRALEGNSVLIQEAVTRVIPQTAGFLVRTPDQSFPVDGVVVATSGGESARFLSDFDAELVSRLKEVTYAPIVVVHYSLPLEAKVISRSFGVLFPSGQSSHILGIMFNSEIFPHTAPRGRQLVTVMLGGVSGASIMEASDSEISQRALDELADRLSIRGGEVIAVTRWPRAIPQYVVGHEALERCFKKIEAIHPGLHFVGAERGGIGVSDRIAMGNSVSASEV